MGEYWLFEHIRSERRDWDPNFALQSTINWMNALAFEITGEHGVEAQEQYDSCQATLVRNVGRRDVDPSLASIFGPLFHSLTFSVSLGSLLEKDLYQPWIFASSVISWYYAIYNAFRSMLAACNDSQPETHGGTIKALSGSGLRSKLPHPYNIVATWVKNEDFDSVLPDYSEATASELSRGFDSSRDTARGMLLSYLRGTVKREVEEIKKELVARNKGKIQNFRTRDARELRDRRLNSLEVNFLHCAYRYRGKANYRDSIYFAYGNVHPWLSRNYLSNITTTAQFAVICALAYARRRVGVGHVNSFLEDVNMHLRGHTEATDEVMFWRGLRA